MFLYRRFSQIKSLEIEICELVPMKIAQFTGKQRQTPPDQQTPSLSTGLSEG